MPNESHHPSGQPAEGVAYAGPGYETRDTNVRGIVIFLIGLTAFVIIVQVVLWGVWRVMESVSPPPPPSAVPAMIADQRAELNKAEEEALAGTGGNARMSIDAALGEIEQKGLPLTATGLTEADMNAHSGAAPKNKDEAKPAGKADAPVKN